MAENLNTTDFLTKVWVSAEELYGPVDVEPFKRRMNALESLKDSNVVNRSFDLFLALSGATETVTARTLQLKKIRARQTDEQMRSLGLFGIG
ncbi:hypothetical protein HK100_009109 [Physocladia obscura]|uniref:Uncharacterized protein n=1 Tax=Physocladia obscura TaxID=109957 RepID=A0AAD5SPV8_9FUNG|nr:hypothetical protein HK100_009109 [Physocladia obscura]